MKLRLTPVLLYAVLFLFAGCGGSVSSMLENEASPAVELYVSAAASLTDVMDELFALYSEQAPGITFIPNYGASGTLQTQIEEGAPADLFFSAAQKQMDALDEKGLLLDGSRRDLLQNKVVLIAAKDNASVFSFEDAAGETVKTVALGEPKGVPVGQYAEEIFTYLGILDQVRAKATYGSDVRQVLTWVESGEAACGVVYATDAVTSDKVDVVCEAPDSSCKPVIYPAAILQESKNAGAARAFLDFLSTGEAKTIFAKYGFTAL